MLYVNRYEYQEDSKRENLWTLAIPFVTGGCPMGREFLIALVIKLKAECAFEPPGNNFTHVTIATDILAPSERRGSPATGIKSGAFYLPSRSHLHLNPLPMRIQGPSSGPTARYQLL
jgi:hypothetical protein